MHGTQHTAGQLDNWTTRQLDNWATRKPTNQKKKMENWKKKNMENSRGASRCVVGKQRKTEKKIIDFGEKSPSMGWKYSFFRKSAEISMIMIIMMMITIVPKKGKNIIVPKNRAIETL